MKSKILKNNISNCKDNSKIVVPVNSNRTFTNKKAENSQSYREAAIGNKVASPTTSSVSQKFNSVPGKDAFSLTEFFANLVAFINQYE